MLRRRHVISARRYWGWSNWCGRSKVGNKTGLVLLCYQHHTSYTLDTHTARSPYVLLNDLRMWKLFNWTKLHCRLRAFVLNIWTTISKDSEFGISSLFSVYDTLCIHWDGKEEINQRKLNWYNGPSTWTYLQNLQRMLNLVNIKSVNRVFKVYAFSPQQCTLYRSYAW